MESCRYYDSLDSGLFNWLCGRILNRFGFWHYDLILFHSILRESAETIA